MCSESLRIRRPSASCPRLGRLSKSPRWQSFSAESLVCRDGGLLHSKRRRCTRSPSSLPTVTLVEMSSWGHNGDHHCRRKRRHVRFRLTQAVRFCLQCPPHGDSLVALGRHEGGGRQAVVVDVGQVLRPRVAPPSPAGRLPETAKRGQAKATRRMALDRCGRSRGDCAFWTLLRDSHAVTIGTRSRDAASERRGFQALTASCALVH